MALKAMKLASSGGGGNPKKIALITDASAHPLDEGYFSLPWAMKIKNVKLTKGYSYNVRFYNQNSTITNPGLTLNQEVALNQTIDTVYMSAGTAVELIL